jgi:hypothetical protein
VPSRRDKDDKKQDTPSLLPSDAPFGPPPKSKRRLFGRKDKDGSDASPDEPETEPLEDVRPPEAGRPAPPKRPPPPPPLPPPLPEAPSPRPGVSRTSTVPNPDENELEFVFTGSAGTPSVPALKKERVVTTEAVAVPPAEPREARGVSRGAIIAIAVLLLLVAAVGAYALFFADDDPAPTPIPTVAPTTEPTTTPEPTATAVALSEECTNSFLFAQANTEDPSRLVRTGDLCTTAEEWVAGAKAHPAAVGAASADEVDNNDLLTFCGRSPDTKVCDDASNKGLLATPAPPESPAASPAASPASTPAASPAATEGRSA